MALVNCSECSQKISDQATNCPKCGAPVNLKKIKEKQQNTNKGCLIFVAIIIFIAILVNTCSDSSNNKNIEAYVYSQQLVEQQLKSPATAEFPIIEDKFITITGNIYTIKAYVDSQNSFGAIIRSNYTCKLKLENDLFYVEELTIDK